MKPTDSIPQYRVWGYDDVAYGPVELPTLLSWVKNERVDAQTWVFLDHQRAWSKAAEVPELKTFFPEQLPGAQPPLPAPQNDLGIKPGSLRRIKIFATMDEKQLASFLQYMEIVRVRQFASVVKRSEHGEGMYLVLEGELRAFTVVDGKETTLATLGVGEFFGEISLLDQGPRSADVSANADSLLLKISAPAFEHLVSEAPALATPFLLALSRSIAGRMRGLTRRYEDSIHFSRLGGERS